MSRSNISFKGASSRSTETKQFKTVCDTQRFARQ